MSSVIYCCMDQLLHSNAAVDPCKNKVLNKCDDTIIVYLLLVVCFCKLLMSDSAKTIYSINGQIALMLLVEKLGPECDKQKIIIE